MGQQQLILLVLATVIVGLAIVVGIGAFNQNSAKANADAMTQDAVRIANDMQAWKQKPGPFGGQGDTQTDAIVQDASDFTSATLAVLGYGNTYSNDNGTYTITVNDASSTTITGKSLQQQNEISVVVTGLDEDTISGTITCLDGVKPSDGSDCTVS